MTRTSRRSACSTRIPRVLSVVAGVLGAIGVAGAAWAYWTAAGAGGAGAGAGTLAAPGSVVATFPNPAARAVHVTWGATVGPDGAPLGGSAAGYYVQRYLGATASPACGSSPAALLAGTSTSCDDTGLASSTYSYRVVAVFRSWTATSSPSGAVTVPASVVHALAISPVTATVTAGQAQAYTAVGTDQYGASLGDVTSATAFSMAPDGSCAGASCTATVASSHAVTATDSGVTATATLIVRAGPASQLAFTTQPGTGQSVTAGGVFSLRVAVEDTYGNVVTTDNTTGVSLAVGTNPGGSTLACTNPGATGPVTVAGGVASFSCSLNKAAGGYTLAATSSPGHGTATSQAFAVVAGAPSRLAFSSAAVTGTASSVASLGPITVEAEDSFGNPAPVTSTTVVALSSSSSGTRIFATTLNGTSGVTSVSIPSGSSSTVFYYGDTKAGGPTITASSSLGNTTQTETVTAAAVAGLAFTGADHTLSCGAIASSYACTVSPALGNNGSVTASVSFVDRFGNLAVQSAATDSTISLSPTPKGTLTPASRALTVLKGTTTSTGTLMLTKSGGNAASTTASFGSFSVSLTAN